MIEDNFSYILLSEIKEMECEYLLCAALRELDQGDQIQTLWIIVFELMLITRLRFPWVWESDAEMHLGRIRSIYPVEKAKSKQAMQRKHSQKSD